MNKLYTYKKWVIWQNVAYPLAITLRKMSGPRTVVHSLCDPLKKILETLLQTTINISITYHVLGRALLQTAHARFLTRSDRYCISRLNAASKRFVVRLVQGEFTTTQTDNACLIYMANEKTRRSSKSADHGTSSPIALHWGQNSPGIDYTPVKNGPT